MSTGYIEQDLSKLALEHHQLLASLQEELEAIDSYQQRANVTEDPELKALFIHHRDDELEHATMLLEWWRRQLPQLDEQMQKLLFTSGDIIAKAKDKKES
jgi:hypothetical protein